MNNASSAVADNLLKPNDMSNTNPKGAKIVIFPKPVNPIGVTI